MDYFTPVAVVVTLALDICLNSLLEPLYAHISVVILLTCLQVCNAQACMCMTVACAAGTIVCSHRV